MNHKASFIVAVAVVLVGLPACARQQHRRSEQASARWTTGPSETYGSEQQRQQAIEDQRMGAGHDLESRTERDELHQPPSSSQDELGALGAQDEATRQQRMADACPMTVSGTEVNAAVFYADSVLSLIVPPPKNLLIGMGLVNVLTLSEFKAVLAHEFGHYHSGDVKLGPWIYKTRAAIGRTIEQLSGSILQRIFIWYGRLFLRITHAVSRRQELIADEVAARAAGAGAMVSGLRKVHASAVAFQSYWRSELSPILSSGHLPPVSQGFSRFMKTERVAASLAQAVQKEEADGRTDPFDTHPSLKERAAALRPLPEGAAGDERPATALLSDLGAWERRILGAVVSDEWARGLKPVTWDRVVPDIYVDDRILHDAYRPTFVKTVAMVPVGSPPFAAIGAYWAQEHTATQSELEMLQAMADSAAISLRR